MKLAWRQALLWLSVPLLSSSLTLALSSPDAVRTGWTPLVRLYGRGDAATAVKELRRLTVAYTAALHHTELDKTTRAFVDGLLDDIEDFDLDSFHERLPEQHGETRSLRVRGDLADGKYLVREVSGEEPFEVGLGGPRTELAAMSGVVTSKPGRGYEERPTYLLTGQYGLGVGALSWDATTDAITELARLVSQGKLADDAAAPELSAQTRRLVHALHPRLSDEDLAVLGVLFEAYPELAKMLSRLGTTEDVRTTWHGKGYQQINVRMRALLERLGEHYPALAKHLGRLDDIARAELRWLDKQGRTLGTAKLDSDKMSFEVQYFIKDGKLLPSRGVQVFEDEPIDYMSDALDGTRTVIDARFKMLGVVVKLHQLVLENWYEPHQSYAEMGTTIRSVPKAIHVEGRALGFLPTGLVDAFIPGNIESITRSFFEVAARGNGKKGVRASLRLGSRGPSADGVAELRGEAEALDSFLVKIGLGMVNEKLIPNDKAVREAKQFATALHDAFVRDLARYARKPQGG